MAFQKNIQLEQGFGVAGSLATDSPSRIEPLVINSSGKKNVFGHAFTKNTATNEAQVGGAISADRAFAGLLVSNKEAALQGGLNPSLTVADNSIGSFATMGDIVVQVSTQCKIGDYLVYDVDTGELSTVTDSSSLGGKQLVPNARIYRYPVTNSSGGLTVVRLTN